MTAWQPSPREVVEALASLDVGRVTPSAVIGWKGKLRTHPDEAALSLWVLVIVCRIEPCSACDALGLPRCHDCLGYLKSCPVEDENLQETVQLVRETCQWMNRTRARSRR